MGTGNRCGIIGYGKVGSCLSKALNNNGLLEWIVTSKAQEIKEGNEFTNIQLLNNIDEITKLPDFMILCVPDNKIISISNHLANKFRKKFKNKIILHTSGISGFDLLETCQSFGALVGAAHPYQTFYYPTIDILNGIGWGIASTDCFTQISELIKLLNGNPVDITNLSKNEKILYHVSAVVASNYLNSVIVLAKMIAQKANINYFDFIPQIIKKTTDNNFVSDVNLPMPITGPIARGDLQIISSHLESLSIDNLLKEDYSLMGLSLLKLAHKQGLINEITYHEITKLFEGTLK